MPEEWRNIVEIEWNTVARPLSATLTTATGEEIRVEGVDHIWWEDQIGSVLDVEARELGAWVKFWVKFPYAIVVERSNTGLYIRAY